MNVGKLILRRSIMKKKTTLEKYFELQKKLAKFEYEHSQEQWAKVARDYAVQQKQKKQV